jgi:hypothetical protein
MNATDESPSEICLIEEGWIVTSTQCEGVRFLNLCLHIPSHDPAVSQRHHLNLLLQDLLPALSDTFDIRDEEVIVRLHSEASGVSGPVEAESQTVHTEAKRIATACRVVSKQREKGERKEREMSPDVGIRVSVTPSSDRVGG